MRPTIVPMLATNLSVAVPPLSKRTGQYVKRSLRSPGPTM